MLVTADLVQVEDTIETWADRRQPAATGTIEGIVVDLASGQPLMDTNVSIGGLHTATDYDRYFRVDGIAAGKQRITVYRTLGDYLPTVVVVEVPEDGVAETRIKLSQAQLVEVTFEVELPDDTPADAEIRLVGSVFQTGARPGGYLNYPFVPDMNPPLMERIATGRTTVTPNLYQGTYLQYFYSVGSPWSGMERTGDGSEVYRSFIAGTSPETRPDRIVAWRWPYAVRLTLHVQVPANTTQGALLALEMGPARWMIRTGPYEWTIFLQGFPGDKIRY